MATDPYLIQSGAIAAQFLIKGNLIDRKGHLMRVVRATRVWDRVDLVLTDLDAGNVMVQASIHGGVEVELWDEVTEQEFNAAMRAGR
jgi:hypothetical protein